MHRRLGLLVGGLQSQTLPQGIVQAHGPEALPQQLTERHIREAVHGYPLLDRQPLKRVPDFTIDLDATPHHRTFRHQSPPRPADAETQTVAARFLAKTKRTAERIEPHKGEIWYVRCNTIFTVHG
jgi:hypothetical protein